MTRRKAALAAAALLLLAGCASTAPSTPTATGSATPQASATADSALLADFDLTGMDGAQIVDHLDQVALSDRPADLMASVRVDELLLSDDTRELAVDLPDDRFYLSVAPYVSTTHDCFFHSLTTCRGELAGEQVHVTVTDADGEVLVDEPRTTYANGFVGLWLPRDVEGTVRVASAGRTGSVPFSTGDDGATCLTTLQLA